MLFALRVDDCRIAQELVEEITVAIGNQLGPDRYDSKEGAMG
jgi:hypothetical protein